ncbi:MAG: ABC transporter permease [Anaerolineales bacterium]|nr:ABC transporter permease [Anaerolineales bacterium]
MLFLTVVVAIFLTIMIANMGGYVDQIRRGEIRENVNQRAIQNPAIRNLEPAERQAWIATNVAIEEDRLGLNDPFIVRTANYMSNALSLNLGRSQYLASDSGSRQVRLIILERLPTTLVLFGTANLLLFFFQLFAALALSRKYGSFWDRVIIALTPLNAAPGWFYGIFLILIFAAIFRILPFGGMVDAPPPANRWLYALSLMEHMILPIMALAISGSFIAIYYQRTFFLIYSSEDYVEMAKAKGLPSKDIERRYVLRPTLPTIITQFLLGLVFVWTGAPIFETIFEWPGLGRTLFQAVGLYDTPVIVGSTVLFAYILALTVFLLDFIYVLVDPRVKIGGGGGTSA